MPADGAGASVSRLEDPGEIPPEKVAEVVVSLSGPMEQTIKEIAAETGVSSAIVSGISQALQKKGLMLSRALGEVTKTKTRDMFQYLAWRILEGVSEKDIEKASLKDKMLSAAIGVDKALLLDGQPTQILSVPQMENIDKLAGMLIEEARRRGNFPEVNEGIQQVMMAKRIGVGERFDPTRNASAPGDEPK